MNRSMAEIVPGCGGWTHVPIQRHEPPGNAGRL
jgi:hypothetical protein